MFQVASTCHPLSCSIGFADSASGVSVSGVSLSLVADNGLLSTVLGCLLSLFVVCGFSSVILGRPLFFITYESPLSRFSHCFLFFVLTGGSLSAVSSDLSSLVVGDDALSTISYYFLSLIAGSGPLSVDSGYYSLFFMLFTSFWALVLTNTPSYIRYSSLPSLLLFHSFLSYSPTPLVCKSTLLIKKRLFDQAFIT